jgi:hypothetical protein
MTFRRDHQQISRQREGPVKLPSPPDRFRRKGRRRDDGAELVAAEAEGVAQQGEHRKNVVETKSVENDAAERPVERHRFDVDGGRDERQYHQQKQSKTAESCSKSKQEAKVSLDPFGFS